MLPKSTPAPLPPAAPAKLVATKPVAPKLAPSLPPPSAPRRSPAAGALILSFVAGAALGAGVVYGFGLAPSGVGSNGGYDTANTIEQKDSAQNATAEQSDDTIAAPRRAVNGTVTSVTADTVTITDATEIARTFSVKETSVILIITEVDDATYEKSRAAYEKALAAAREDGTGAPRPPQRATESAGRLSDIVVGAYVTVSSNDNITDGTVVEAAAVRIIPKPEALARPPSPPSAGADGGASEGVQAPDPGGTSGSTTPRASEPPAANAMAPTGTPDPAVNGDTPAP